MSELSGEYPETDQRYAICVKSWEDKFSNVARQFHQSKMEEHFSTFENIGMLKFAGEKVSIDYDDTLSTERGKQVAKNLLNKGVDLHIVTRRQETAGDAVYKTAEELGIPRNKVHFTNGKYKWETIKRLGIVKHYDNNPKELEEIRKNLPNVKTVKFALDEFKSHSDYPESVKNNAKAVLKYVEENGWGSCGTPVGKMRVNQLAKGEPISEETIKRMYSYLSRHKVDLDSSKGYGDGCGKLMYDSWGGLSALSWAESKINQIEKDKR